jgi:hypothetical protein
MSQFSRYIGIAYSGAETADFPNCNGIREFIAGRNASLRKPRLHNEGTEGF